MLALPKKFQKDEVKDHLIEMFPDYSLSRIEAVAFMASGLDDAVEMIVAGKEVTIIDIVSRYQKRIQTGGNYYLKITRDNIYREGLTFYKCALAKKVLLTDNFHVEFKNEDGIDAGAIKVEFFVKFFEAILKELFEQVGVYSIPKRSAGNLVLFKIVGVAIAHSIVQGGPSFSALHPYCYAVMCEQSEEEISILLATDVIPLSAATGNLLQFINKITECANDQDLNDVFIMEEGPAFEQLVNSSQWDASLSVTMNNRETLLSMLIFEELVLKRERQLKAIREGLKYLNLLEIVKRNYMLFKSSFVSEEKPLTANDLDFEYSEASSEKERNALSWFKNMVENMNSKHLEMLLKFSTSYNNIPKFQSLKICVTYMQENEGIYPKSSACSETIRLPTMHNSKEEFEFHIISALELECEGFFEP